MTRARRWALLLILTIALTGSGCGSGEDGGIINPPPPDPEPPTEVDWGPDWSPDGTTIAYVHYGAIRLLDLTTGAIENLGAGAVPSWSPAGDQLAYTLNGNIYVLTLASGERRQLTSYGSCFYPAWSPQGDWIAYDISVCNACGVWLMRPDGSDNHQLVQSGRMPSWSHDGGRIAYELVADERATEDIFVVNLTSGASNRLTSDSTFTDRDPAWSPTDSDILWSRTGEGRANQLSGIWLMDTTGTTSVQLIAPAADAPWTAANGPVWSPSGDHIIYSGYNRESNTYTLWMADSDGSNPHRLTSPNDSTGVMPLPEGDHAIRVSP